jgi:transposase
MVVVINCLGIDSTRCRAEGAVGFGSCQAAAGLKKRDLPLGLIQAMP